MKNKNIHFKTTTPLVRSLSISFVGLVVLTLTAWAGTPALEGTVKDPIGRPVKGADVRIEAKNFAKIVKTNASGRYTCDGLAVATYKVTLVVNGSVAASTLNAVTKPGIHTQLNFDLTTKTALAARHTHSVYCPTETGTLIGGIHGRWIEVDDNGNIVNDTVPNGNTGTSSVEKVSGSALQTFKTAPGRGHGTFSTIPGN